MSALETTLLAQRNRTSNPLFYVRYVDDILTVFQDSRHINYFIRRLQNHSVLTFTHETMSGNQFHFLDVKFTVNRNSIQTSVYIKPTDRGTYSHFSSHTAESYKTSAIKSLLYRAIKLSSTWSETDSEIRRLHQVFANNHYPQNIIEKLTNQMLKKYNAIEEPPDTTQDIKYFIQLTNLKTFKSDEKIIKNIVTRFVKPTADAAKITTIAYFKPTKLSSCFSSRPSIAQNDRSHVVYQFTCSESGCSSTYIGYTANKILTRCKQHRYNGSNIYKHYAQDHSTTPPPADQFIDNFNILHSNTNVNQLRIIEAIEIKLKNPFINVKYEEYKFSLNLFWIIVPIPYSLPPPQICIIVPFCHSHLPHAHMCSSHNWFTFV